METNPPNNNKKTVTHGSNCIKKVSENPSPKPNQVSNEINPRNGPPPVWTHVWTLVELSFWTPQGTDSPLGFLPWSG